MLQFFLSLPRFKPVGEHIAKKRLTIPPDALRAKNGARFIPCPETSPIAVAKLARWLVYYIALSPFLGAKV